MIHIGIDARLTYYRTGGISTYMRRLIQALEKLDSGSRYTVFQSRKAREVLTTRFDYAPLWTPCHHRLERLALSAELARFRLDLLHSPDFIPPLRGAKRHIITVHDLTFLHYPQYLTADARRYYNGHIEEAVRQADHILVDSEATRRDLMTMLHVPETKITVHMLGVDERFRRLSADITDTYARKLDLPAPYILFVGTLEPRKNIAGLLEAYSLLLKRMPDAPPILMVGKRGWLFDETIMRIDQMRLREHIIWRENVDDDGLPIVYNRASVLVAPSFYEGFGLTALEAMACGTVPIVSNRSSLPEVVGDVGLQIDPDSPEALAEALEKALLDANWRQVMQAAGIERAAQFTWDKTAAVTLSTYRTVGEH